MATDSGFFSSTLKGSGVPWVITWGWSRCLPTNTKYKFHRMPLPYKCRFWGLRLQHRAVVAPLDSNLFLGLSLVWDSSCVVLGQPPLRASHTSMPPSFFFYPPTPQIKYPSSQVMCLMDLATEYRTNPLFLPGCVKRSYKKPFFCGGEIFHQVFWARRRCLTQFFNNSKSEQRKYVLKRSKKHKSGEKQVKMVPFRSICFLIIWSPQL